MAETQRQPVPRNDDGELDTALAFLAFVRDSVVKKTERLDDEQLRRPMVETGTSLLGLVQHLAVGERYWFGHVLAGHGDDDREWDFTMTVPVDATAAAVIDDYRAAVAESDAAIAAAAGPDALTVRAVDDTPKSMRWVVAHMTGETARHAGHADILRELVDGTTGR